MGNVAPSWSHIRSTTDISAYGPRFRGGVTGEWVLLLSPNKKGPV